MPPSLAARDSPRAQHGRRRAPRSQFVRSQSLFGTLKNMITAPLSWFTAYDDQENSVGKRGRADNGPVDDEPRYSEGQPSAKRKRVDSPEPDHLQSYQQPARTSNGYLDVPDNMLPKQHLPRNRPSGAPGHGRSSSLFTSLAVPSNSDAYPARRTASPTGITAYTMPSMVQRTQSMDPPQYRPLSLSRDVSMEDGVAGSVPRDVTMSPSRRTPFQLRARSSLTPQPTGQTFGPQPRHKEKDQSEPPPLAALMTKPMFVKPPPQASQPLREQSVTTLGSLAEVSGRSQSRSPMRQHSGLFFGARPGSIAQSSSTPIGYPINAAEQALHDLDVYKTPLLPSRLRGAQSIPEMFKPKKSHAPVLMSNDRERERKPRLGTSEKKKGKKKDEEAPAPKPYAGRGGTKKMLARRKLEEKQASEKERASAIETDQDEEAESAADVRGVEVPDVNEPLSPPPVVPAVRTSGGREQSSLRVGRTRTARSHIARPVSKAKNRFSAVFDDEDVDDAMGDEGNEADEPKKIQPIYESPKGFTFAQEKAPVLQDSSNAREPPIAALPFSFAKPSTTPAPSSLAPPFSFGEPSKPVTSSFIPAPASTEEPVPKTPEPPRVANVAQPTPLFPPIPSIALVPPSPAPPKPVEETSAASAPATPAIPNFFANSAVFSKPGVTVAPPTVATPVPAPVMPETTQETKPGAPPLFSAPPSFAPFAASTPPKESIAVPNKEPATTPAFSFGAPPAAASTSSTSSLFPSPMPQTKEAAPSAPVSSYFPPVPATSAPAKTIPTPPTTEVKAPAPAAPPAFSFGVTAKPAEVQAPAPSLFSFGTSTASTTAAPASTPSSAPFTFGQSNSSESTKAAQAKPLFGTAEPPKTSLFGAPDAPKPSFGAPAPSTSPFGGSQASGNVEAPKPFTFGQPTPSPQTPAVNIEAPKPLFPSTSSGGSGGFTFGASAPSAPSPATPVKSPFTFGATPSTPPVTTPAENKSFAFGVSTPSVTAPTTLFGGPSNHSQNGENKPFAFGATPARPITPPQKEQEMQMEESPTRPMDMNPMPQTSLNSLKPSGGGFSFGGAASSPFGQPSQPASSPFAFGANQPKQEDKPTTSFASFGQQNSSATPFSFGQKSAESTQSPITAPFGGSSNPFGQASSSAPSAPFAFGPSTSGGFGQQSQPASPSTFGQPGPTPFAFGATPTSATAPSNPFAFSSQPASPATGNAGLPQPPGSSGGGGGFSFGASSPAASPSSPFGAAPSLPQAGGGVTFTMGSAAPANPTNGPRTIKKLPNRRGGRAR